MHERSWPARILDVLELEAVWMNTQQIHTEMLMRFGFVSMPTIQRSVARLIDNDNVETRLVDISDSLFSKQMREIRTLYA